jgi:GTP-binding protein EngB required for normal cell division
MQTLIDIEEQQLNKLLFYTHAKNGTEAITQIIQDYLSQKDKLNNQFVVMQKKQLLQTIQHRFSSIPKEISLVDELIAERRLEALKELE